MVSDLPDDQTDDVEIGRTGRGVLRRPRRRHPAAVSTDGRVGRQR